MDLVRTLTALQRLLLSQGIHLQNVKAMMQTRSYHAIENQNYVDFDLFAALDPSQCSLTKPAENLSSSSILSSFPVSSPGFREKLPASGMANHGAFSFCLPFACFLVIALSQSQSDQFIFHGFNDSAESPMIFNGASIIKPSGALKLTNMSSDDIGQAFYRRPFQMLAKSSASNGSAALSFSTHFVFAIRPPSSGEGGYGLAFVVAPKTSFPGAKAEHYLGLFNSSNDGDPSNHMLVVEFDTVNGYKGTLDSKGNHVGLNLNGMDSIATMPAAYNIDGKSNNEEITMESGKAIQGWIEYNSSKQLVDITISPIDVAKPVKPLLSVAVNLTSIFEDTMYVGFSASTGTKRSLHYVLGWSFRLNGTATPLNLSRLPLPPDQTDSSSSSYKPQIVALIASLCVIAVCLLGIFFFHTMIKKRRQHENLEDWELDCPHRFRYRDLHEATKGFKQSEVIGIGGFGAVYHGILPTNRCEVAVKKVSRNSIQGMREFVAEIESLGRLRHKNLVNLQGWCKQKDELLLVYDYVPYGSLDSLIFKRKDGFVLNWEHRFHIVKGVAAGLLYLHEEWEQVVIHRDVKSSNVLIDAEMNARLGDFGLARLYEHGKMSHTTNLVGTIGYIAPELARSGKASTSSDVYAYGILLLEVASGRRPTGSSQFLLMDWVIECYETGRILDAADPKLGSAYDAEEMERVLNLGLACSQYHAQARPTMRQVIRYLNRDEPVPVFTDDPNSAGSRGANDMSLRLFEAVSSDTTTGTSHASTSSRVSSSVHSFSTSLGGGR
ncbi:lectin-domain containing receptor kinase VI.3-like [Rhodamnia argentea]|uniref:Lectin-domain containing receptor kinase VI.3-like n=1 Tax=Rhodamnia argentea TaxID=178133 RepID=A0A8B8Q5U7_9MYRT|nr:lectin-domain containing receptor kinase VI.3-like [Rhodamnia argentea]